MSKRREFRPRVKVEIRRRANKELPSGFKYIACEKCGKDCYGKFIIDHIIPDAFSIDKSRPLTALEGQLLCLACNEIKTKADIEDIAKAKRREASHLGVKRRPKQPMQSNSTLRGPERAHEGRGSIPRRSLYEDVT